MVVFYKTNSGTSLVKNAPHNKTILDNLLAPLISDDVLMLDENGNITQGTHDERNFKEAVELLNRELPLGLDDTDIEMFSLLYEQLKTTRRFDVQKRITKKENSATHSLFCLPFMQEIALNAKKVGVPTEDITGVQQLTSLAMMIHDGGEALGEFASVKEMLEGIEKDPKTVNKVVLEEVILSHVLGHALMAVETGDHQAYHDHVNGLREQLNIRDSKTGKAAKINPTRVEEVLSAAPKAKLSQDMQKRHDLWMGIWKLVEDKDYTLDADLTGGELALDQHFVKWLGKSLEHMQGTLHILRHGLGEKEKPFLDTAYSDQTHRDLDPKHNAFSFEYAESELPWVFHHAQSASDEQIARQYAKLFYERMEKYTEEHLPYFDNFLHPIKPDSPYGQFLASPDAPAPSAELNQRSSNMLYRAKKGIANLYAKAAQAVTSYDAKAGAYRFTPGFMTFDEAGHVTRHSEPVEGSKPEVLAFSRPAILSAMLDQGVVNER